MSVSTPHSGIVIQAAQRFAERHMPIGALVAHETHGQGIVALTHGHIRIVDFERIINKTAAELTPEEWPEGCGDDLFSVGWIEIDRHEVAVASLRELARKARDRYTRWAE